ncbi:hypothetical protein MNEG_14877 [Monoraphidium neglectum]|uniref:Uncharacterized protein n=1 Tax=Monoraphidium neglectum TaxID=145388 RepID=A0A0D2MCY9_9CHLO|nr:hypothetical protein MNEG_14877 [Monoraphidium neglectum]KIY93085.1 hypothetical protein MNEG_14877 [Monoraphidium neglectum]|eukprot:XP_013892105.1 hypothetical protein MNEG_14877 [Monoraphidium neglectum]
MGKVVALKKSRDRLLAQLDRQSAEGEQAALEVKLLGEQLAEARDQAARWEAQAQDGLSTISRLKDCLEDGAAWGGEGGTTAEEGGGPPQADESAEARAARLQGEVVSGQARAAALDLRSRALAAEVLRAHAARAALGRALVPLLSGVEARLLAAREAAALAR